MTSSFFRSTKIVLLGMAAAQAIPLLGSLVVARLYIPAEFGEFSTWLGAVMTLAVLVTGRLEMALTIEADGEPRRDAMAATLATTCAVAFFLLVLSWGLYLVVPEARRFSAGLFFALVPATVLMAVSQSWQSWAAAEGQYPALSWMRISQAAAVTGIQIMVGLLAPNAASLAIGHGLGMLLGIVVATRWLPLHLNVFVPWSEFRKKTLKFWSSHRRFPLFALPADFINSAAGQLPLFFITSRFGAEASGLYALTTRMLGGPISLLGTAVLDVFKRSAAESYRKNGHCREDYVRTFKILGVLGIVLGLGIMLLAEPLFLLAFGETWRQAGVIAVWLMPMFAMRLVASPLSYVMYIAGKQKSDLVWQCCLLGMTVFAFTMGPDLESSLKAYAAGYAAMYVIYLLVSYRYSKGVDR